MSGRFYVEEWFDLPWWLWLLAGIFIGGVTVTTASVVKCECDEARRTASECTTLDLPTAQYEARMYHAIALHAAGLDTTTARHAIKLANLLRTQ